MIKRLFVALLFCSAPLIAWSEPIKYTATFTASGTLTKADGTVQPFDGRVIFSILRDTTRVHALFDDGEFAGYETASPFVIFIEEIGEMRSLVDMQSTVTRNSMEFYAYTYSFVSPTFLFGYSGLYDLKSPFASKGPWTINYFNMGYFPTTEGTLTFDYGSSTGGFAGTLVK